MDSSSSNKLVAPQLLHITDTMRAKAIVVELVATRIPINRYGLPEGFYRPDLLPNNIEDLQTNVILDGDGSTTIITPNMMAVGANRGSQGAVVDDLIDEDRLEAAFVKLDYNEGFPALQFGNPFWSQFDFEMEEAYDIFLEYLALGKKGVRLLSILASQLNYALEDLRVYANLYYWVSRAKAYDLFSAVVIRRQRSIAIIEMQDEHLETANKLNDIAMTFIEGEDFEELLSPKIALEALKIAVQMKRLSLDQPANAPPNFQGNGGGNNNGGAQHVTTEVIIQQMVGDQPIHTTSGVTTTANREAAMRDRLLADPETAKIAQDLLLKLAEGDV